MADYKFNRQELFTQDDIREVMNIIADVESHIGDFHDGYDNKIFTVVNQLFGLLDGVLYDDLVHHANMAMLPVKLVARIHRLSDKIVKHILAKNGEQVEEHSFERVWIP